MAKDHWDGIEAYLEFQGHPAHFGRIQFDPQNLADSLSSRSRPKASSSAPPVRRSGPSGVHSLGSAPLTQSSDAEAVGVARRPGLTALDGTIRGRPDAVWGLSRWENSLHAVLREGRLTPGAKAEVPEGVHLGKTGRHIQEERPCVANGADSCWRWAWRA